MHISVRKLTHNDVLFIASPFNRSTPIEVFHTLVLEYQISTAGASVDDDARQKKEILARLRDFNTFRTWVKLYGNVCQKAWAQMA